MGYKYTLDENGLPIMSYDPDATIATDLLLSAMIEKGAWFFNRDFGREKEPAKIRADTVKLVESTFKNAAKWLLDNGRAASIETTAKQDPGDRTRIDILQEAKQANNQPAKFETFVGLI